MTVCSCHVTYAFQSETTLYSCLNVKELLDIQWLWVRVQLQSLKQYHIKTDTQIISLSQSINGIETPENKYVRFQRKEFAFSKTA